MILADSTTFAAEQSLLAIAVVILLGPFLAQKLRLPGIVGLVLGGTLIGPEGIGWMAPGQLDGLGDIGLLYLMFMAGLELDLALLKRYRSAALRFGLLTFIFPFAIGVTGAAVGGLPRTAAILFGSIWASHTLVSLPEVKRAGLSSNRAVAISVSATALTDILALSVLAVVTSGASDEPGGHPMLMLAIGLLALGVYCLWLVPLLGARIFRVVAQDRAVRFVFLLGVFASAAQLAGAFGIEGLVGAFLAGLGANRLVPAGGPLMERTEFVGSSLFIPMFLIYVGTQLDPAALGSPQTLKLAAGYLAIVVVGKTLAAVVSGRIEKLRLAEVGLMTGLTMGQAAATLAATLVGQSIGLFDDQIVNAVLVTVLMVILLSSVTTALFARQIHPEVPTDRALGTTVMLSVPEGGVPDALVSIATRLSLAHAGRLVPLCVISQGATEEERTGADEDLARAVEVATGLGADVEGVVRIDATTAEGLLNASAEHGGSVIVVPWDPVVTRTERLFGRSLEEIGRRSPVPVVAGHVPTEPAARAVLAVEGPLRTGGARLDAELATTVLSALSHDERAIVLCNDEDLGQELFAHRGPILAPQIVDDLGSALTELAPDDLVLIPAEQLGRGVHRAIPADPHRLTLIVAGPYRLQTAGRAAATGLSPLLGFQCTAPT